MIKAALATGILLLCLSAGAQTKKRLVMHRGHGVVEAPAPPVIYAFVEQGAAFRGDVSEYLRKNLRYPDYARDERQEGTADILFEIRRDGTVRFLSVRRSSGSCALDAEARRVVCSMPRWMPAKKQGLPVRTLMVLPIVFRLN
jgi:TonB family protein